MDIDRWGFARSLGDDRRAALLSPSVTFQGIAEEIRKQMRPLCWHSVPSVDMTIGFSRVTFCIHVGQPLFDLFFNSEQGYRASYFRNPDDGLRDNASFIASVSPVLIAWGRANGDASPDSFWRKAEEGLRRSSAKVWLAERGQQLCARCQGEWTDPQDDTAEILNGRWERRDNPNARRGRKAPYLTKLRIFGAFLKANGDEFIAARKRLRAQQISSDGWS